MEAPEKIYIADEEGCRFEKSDSEIAWNYKPPFDAVEYTRKDAFIKRVLKFLDEKFYFNNLHYSIESGLFDSKEEMFEDFRSHMKGE